MRRLFNVEFQFGRRSRLAKFLNPADLPERYAMFINGNCMAPELPNGECVAFSKSEPYRAGDLVVIHRRPETLAPGEPQSMVKRLAMAIAPWVTFPHREHPDSDVRAIVLLEQINPPGLLQIQCADILAIHKCLGVHPREQTCAAE